jgi:hypothetical protein
MGETLTIVTDETNVSSSCDESTQAHRETEAKLNSDIKSLWSAHQVTKATAKHTRQELETLRFDLGCKLHEMKSLLVRSGRSGGWSSYLRSHGILRGSAERYIKRSEALANPVANRLAETISEPTEEDVRRLVRNLLPRLRRVLTTTRSVAWFLERVSLQLETTDASGWGMDGAVPVEKGDSGGSSQTEAQRVSAAA